MADLNETPSANRIRIAFFGLRNAGKSTLVNAFAGQPVAIVSDVAGTTTDPVSKAMEILPLGPCLITDTAGLDDVGELGRQRVEKSLKVLETTDIAIWVMSDEREDDARARFLAACKERNVVVLEYRRGDSVEELKRKISEVRLGEMTPGLLDGLVEPGDHVVCVCPIDESAPKGRLILPQVQVIRACLDLHVTCVVCQPEELKAALDRLIVGLRETKGRTLVITDSQAFRPVSQTLDTFPSSHAPAFPSSHAPAFPSSHSPAFPSSLSLTSFSILFARQKGDIAAYVEGLAALSRLKDGDRVLIAEGCTHRRQCNDIGAVKIPKALAKLTGRKLEFEFASGAAFPDLPPSHSSSLPPSHSPSLPFSLPPRLIVHCGGCMLTRREVLRRIARAKAAGVPIVNYGMVLAQAAGVDIERCVK